MGDEKTIAEQVSARFDNDGSQFLDKDGHALEDVVGELSILMVYGDGYAHVSDFCRRHHFLDGSVIVVWGDVWDVGFDGCWCGQTEGHKEHCSESQKASKIIPSIVTLCGSTRFYREFQEAYYRETMAGQIVLSVGFYPDSAKQAHGEEIGCTAEQKLALDELHKRKIDMSDEILVLNIDGYIGESTRAEIEYAEAMGVAVRYLEDVEHEEQ